jgi:predicted nucleic acid-binding protein
MKKTTYLDSNVFIRLIIGDVATHAKKSEQIFQQIERGESTGQVSILVINEIVWILEHFYSLDLLSIYISELTRLR